VWDTFRVGIMQIRMHPHTLHVVYSYTSASKAMPALATAVRVKYLQEQIYSRGRGHYISHSDLQNYKNYINRQQHNLLVIHKLYPIQQQTS